MTSNKPAVLISIRPKYCELIANGSKSIEIRKSRPKFETPFKCYIYCTKPSKSYQTKCGSMVLNNDELYRHPAEGIKHGNSIELVCQHDLSEDNFLNGKVIGEFVCTKIDKIRKRGINDNFDYCYLSLSVFGNDDVEIEITDIKKSCIKKEDLNSYGANSNVLYAWHISNLLIYDEPKELSEFTVVDNEAVNHCKYRIRACNNPDYTNGAFLPGGYLCSQLPTT